MDTTTNSRLDMGRGFNYLRHVDLLDLVPGVTLVLLVFWGFTDALATIAIQISLLCVIMRPSLLRSPVVWFPLAIVNTIVLIDVWVSADNHKYLTVYWIYVVAIAVSLRDNDLGEKVLRWHARFFLIFVFCFAAIQKSFSPSYMSGEMFETRLLLDPRFKAFGHLFGLDKSIAEKSLELTELLKNPLAQFEGDTVRLPATDHSRLLALVVTWYDLIVQYLIGLLFIPARRLTDRLGHYVLIFFILTTYLPAPVFGFGWLLTTYGIALSWRRLPNIGITYLFCLVAIFAYQVPWRDWVLQW